MGGNCLQTFASSPRSLQFKEIPQSEIEIYLAKKAASGISFHFFHGVYLVNLASGDPKYLRASLDSLIYYQRLAGQIGAAGTIFHIGSNKNYPQTELTDQIVASINYVLDSSPKNTRLILENAAGQSGSVGVKLEELAQIIARVGDRSKIGVCLDTQHCFAAGYPLESAVSRFDQVLGIKYLSVVHVNDSRTEFNSHVDRHANLGEGVMGLDGLRSFVTDPRLAQIPLILEVPGEADSGPRKEDVDSLRSLIN